MSALAGFINGYADQKKSQKADKEREQERTLRREEIAMADRASERSVQAARMGRSLPADVDGYGGSGGAAAAIPAGERASYIRSGLINRGLPEHVADAFLLNFQDESGLNPGAVEGAPNIHGTRGFGLYQLTDTKPGVGRRSAYTSFAKARGADLGDVDTQLDFMMNELQTSESGAWKAIQAAPDTGTAAAAIVSKFLRPAAEHRDRRMAKYMGVSAPRAPAPAAAPAPAPMQPPAAPAAGVLPPPAALAQPGGRRFTITPGAAAPWSSYKRFT